MQSLQKFDLGGFVVDYSGAAPFVGSHYVDLGVLGASGQQADFFRVSSQNDFETQ